MTIRPHRTYRARKLINKAIKRQRGLTLQRRASSEPASAAAADAAAGGTASAATTSASPRYEMNAVLEDAIKPANMDTHEGHKVPTNFQSSSDGLQGDSRDEDAEQDELMNEDDGGVWHRTLPTKKNKVTKTERVSRTRFSLQLRPLVKMKIRDIPRRAIANAIGSNSPNAELAEMAAIKYDDAANSANITLYDAEHAARLARTDHLTYRYNGRLETIEVRVDRMDLNRNTIRGVIRVDPAESNDTIFNWLRCEQAEILRVQKIGKSDRAIITFDSAVLPRVVKYYMELVRVAEYKPKRVVCFNCHTLGHMAKFCPSPSVCADCGRPHATEEECGNTPFCAACKEPGHLAVSPVCPSRLAKSDEQTQDSAKRETSQTKRDTSKLKAGVSWADAVNTQQKDAPSNPSTPTTSAIIQENNKLKQELQELRAELQQLRSELNQVRKPQQRRQSPSPGPPLARRSRSRVKKNILPQQQSDNTQKWVTKHMLAQRDAQLKFEASKELQKAFKGIHELQGHIHTLKADINQLADQLRSFIETVTPEETKRKKKHSQH